MNSSMFSTTLVGFFALELSLGALVCLILQVIDWVRAGKLDDESKG